MELRTSAVKCPVGPILIAQLGCFGLAGLLNGGKVNEYIERGYTSENVTYEFDGDRLIVEQVGAYITHS